jgi:hypothetical protein
VEALGMRLGEPAVRARLGLAGQRDAAVAVVVEGHPGEAPALDAESDVTAALDEFDRDAGERAGDGQQALAAPRGQGQIDCGRRGRRGDRRARTLRHGGVGS